MENCFVKRLGVLVDDNDLRKFGEVILNTVSLTGNVDISLQCRLRIKANKTISIKTIGDGYFSENPNSIETDKLTSIQFTGQKDLYFKNATYQIQIVSKYDIDTFTLDSQQSGRLQLFRPNINEFSFSGVVNLSLAASRATGKLSALNSCANLVKIDAYNCELSGNIAELPNSITYIKLNSGNNDVNGNVEELASRNLTHLDIRNTSVTGTVETMLTSMASHRNNGDTMQIKTNNLVYYNGTQLSDRTLNVTFDGQGGYSIT